MDSLFFSSHCDRHRTGSLFLTGHKNNKRVTGVPSGPGNKEAGQPGLPGWKVADPDSRRKSCLRGSQKTPGWHLSGGGGAFAKLARWEENSLTVRPGERSTSQGKQIGRDSGDWVAVRESKKVGSVLGVGWLASQATWIARQRQKGKKKTYNQP